MNSREIMLALAVLGAVLLGAILCLAAHNDAKRNYYPPRGEYGVMSQ